MGSGQHSSLASDRSEARTGQCAPSLYLLESTGRFDRIHSGNRLWDFGGALVGT